MGRIERGGDSFFVDFSFSSQVIDSNGFFSTFYMTTYLLTLTKTTQHKNATITKKIIYIMKPKDYCSTLTYEMSNPSLHITHIEMLTHCERKNMMDGTMSLQWLNLKLKFLNYTL